MSYLIVHETPEIQLEYMLIAYGGWADAADSASSALKYLQRRMGAKKFGEIDPEEFYDFTQTRPHSTLTRNGLRRVHWPSNDFSYCEGDSSAKPLMFFLGTEPNLRWRTYARTVADLAKQRGVKTVIHVGALLDAVPHTREIRLTGSATRPDLQSFLDDADIRGSNYQGPTGISSAVMEACTNQGMGYVSLWGHTSHYLQAAPNYRVSYTLVQTLARLLDLKLDLDELKTAAATFDQEVAAAVERDEQISAYVTKLEGHYDESQPDTGIPDPADMVRDLEQFLRSEQRRRPGEPGG